MVYAKSYPIANPESLWDHTEEVTSNAKELQDMFPSLEFLGDKEQYFWDALKIACNAHDLGKLSTPFQYKICNAINNQCRKYNKEPLVQNIESLRANAQKIKEIPHNILSPAFVLKEIKQFPDNIQACICQAIAYHHNRGKNYTSNTRWPCVKQAINDDLKIIAKEHSELGNYFPNGIVIGDKYMHHLSYSIGDNDREFYVMLKGFLHRADYCASADVSISNDIKEYARESIKEWIQRQSNPWQINALGNSFDENIIMLAGTGMGKTEFALCWAAGKKTFYTLPIRTSVNAIYERIKERFSLNADNIGLLHSSATEYLYNSVGYTDNDDGMNQILSVINTTRQMSMQVSVSTADQIFSSVFHYPGYERIYSTMAHSRIIIDELQAYDPGIIAAILHGLVDFSKLGAKFCIITATLPEFCIKYLQDNIDDSIAKPDKQYKKIARHQVKLIDDTIDGAEVIEIIKNHAKDIDKKILIIVNTVKTAINLKKLLDEQNIKTDLLHSRFTYQDRMKKESKIFDAEEKGIWITTQVVEASADIDFDVLITEISTMDSQIQRWGRIWRNRGDTPYTKDAPNIYIIKHPSDKGCIYDTNIVDKTYNLLACNEGKKLSDNDTFDMFNEIFSDKTLEGTRYRESFDKSIRMLETLDFTAENRADAQKLFREVLNISVIPKSTYDNNERSIDKNIKDLRDDNKSKRRIALIEIKKNMVPIPYTRNNLKSDTLDEKYRIIKADVKYSFEYGAELP